MDDDLVIGESRAILSYLCEKYDKNDALYPRDPKNKAVINQRLYFDMGTLYQRHYYPQILHGKPVPEGTFQQFEEVLEFLENQATYVAGESLSIADFAILASIKTFKVAAGLDLRYSGSSTDSWLRVSPVTTKSAFRDPKNLPHSLPTLRNKDKQAVTSFIFDRAHQVAPSHAHAVLFLSACCDYLFLSYRAHRWPARFLRVVSPVRQVPPERLSRNELSQKYLLSRAGRDGQSSVSRLQAPQLYAIFENESRLSLF